MPKTDELKKQIKTLDANWKRALADYQNLLRRVESDRTQLARFGSANVIARLLPSLDIMELASAHSEDLGVRMAATQFSQALKAEGLETIEPGVGDPFDPAVAECSETVDLTGDQMENTISEVVLKGYRLGDLVIRPAKVKVYKKLALDK